MYYQIMMTAGIEFLNLDIYPKINLKPFKTVDNIISARRTVSTKNKSNNSTFISIDSDKVQLFAKTYGANKYEATLFGVALSKVSLVQIEVYAVSEKDLKNLPKPSLNTFKECGNISVYKTSLTLNKRINKSDFVKLRSSAYTFKLLERIGFKKCALCNCEIPEIIDGAHLWSISDIKEATEISEAEKYQHAISGYNGLWLCRNHHKLFDTNLIAFNYDGHCLIKKIIPANQKLFIKKSVVSKILDNKILNDDFRFYLRKRNSSILLSEFCKI